MLKEEYQTDLFIQNWRKKNLELLSKAYPQLTEEQLLEVIDEDIEENFQNPDSMIHNDYQDDMLLKQPLTIIYRFCHVKKPIIAGNGTLFYNQDERSSPISDIIDDRIATRKYYKNLMKDTMDEMNQFEKGTQKYAELEELYHYYDMMQMEAKIRINSIYGSFGAPTFHLYNKYTAASTTGTAQSLISCTGIEFEGFIGDHVLFKSLGECLVFMDNIIHEEYEYIDLTIRPIKDKSIVYDRMVKNFDEGVFDEEVMADILYDYIDRLTTEELTHIYYKNNIYEFIANDSIKNIIVRAFNKVEDFNDPNDVPEEIKEDMDELWNYVGEWVFYNHGYNERINRLKNDKRKSVKLIDTDSNLIYVQPWYDYMLENVVPSCDSKMEGETMMFACVNTASYLITMMLRTLLDKYCESCHVLEKNYYRINMKNEFCFEKLLLAPTKKRYVAKMILREGKPVDKVEIKGHDFKKAGTTEYVRDRMETIINTRILDTPTVDIKGILRDLDDTEEEIFESLRNGERKFLLRMNCKDMEAYKNPYSMGQVLSVLAWNTVCPDDEIQVPDKLDVVLVKIPNAKALEPYRDKFPVQYDRIDRLLLNGPLKPFREKGVKYFAIPNKLDKIPDWIIPLIDYDYLSSRNIGTFKPILTSLEMPMIGSNKIEHFGNVRYNTTIEL